MSPARTAWSDCLLKANQNHPGMDADSRARAYAQAINEFLERVEDAAPEGSQAGLVLLDRTRAVQARRWRNRTPLEVIK